MTAINFDTAPNGITTQPARVWVKTAWADAWTERPDIIALDTQWTLSPDTNTATLYYRYGSVKLPGATSYVTLTEITARGYFVLIEIPEDDPVPAAAWYWLGYAESPINRETYPTRGGVPAAGEQFIPCFGMDALLRQTWIDSTVHVDTPNAPAMKRSIGTAVFNPDDAGNRSTATGTLTVNGNVSPAAYGFVDPFTAGDRWSSKDIVEHLAAFFLPTADGVKVASGGVPFTISGADALPTWDAPQVATEGRSVYDVLEELVRYDRLLSWTMGAIATPGNPPTITSVDIHIETALSTPLTIPNFTNQRANARVHQITASTDPLTIVDLINDDSDVYDQLIVQGPHEVGVATFEIDTDLEPVWSAGEETAYEAGGDGVVTGWAGKEQYAQREDNERIREDQRYRSVFREFRLPSDWDGTVQSGTGEVFEPVDDGGGGTTPFVPYMGTVSFLDGLPLYGEIDYSGDITLVDEADGKTPIGILASIEDPVDSVERSIKQGPRLKVGFNAKHPNAPLDLSIGIVSSPVPTIAVDVAGNPQHAIADDEFTGNDADVDQTHFGGWDYKTMKVTLAMVSPRRSQVVSPAVLPTADVYRRKFLTFDAESLRRVTIAADTMVGFGDDLQPETSDGGLLRDPTDQLTALATVFGEFFLQPRKRLFIDTGRRPLAIGVGDMIQSITPFGVVNCQVRSIQVSIPMEGNGVPRTSIVAASTSFDPMQLFTGRRNAPRGPNKRDRVVEKRNARKAARFDTKLEAIGRDFIEAST